MAKIDIAIKEALWTHKLLPDLEQLLKEFDYSYVRVASGPDSSNGLAAKLVLSRCGMGIGWGPGSVAMEHLGLGEHLLSYDFEEGVAWHAFSDSSGRMLDRKIELDFDQPEGVLGFVSDPATFSIFEPIQLIAHGSEVSFEKPPRATIATICDARDELLKRIAKDERLIMSMKPADFEDFMCRMLELYGYVDIQPTKRTRDGGIDVFASIKGPVPIVTGWEFKHYRRDRKIGVELVRQLRGAVADNRCAVGVLCTTSSFTRGAMAYTEKHQMIRGMDGQHLHEWLQQLSSKPATI